MMTSNTSSASSLQQKIRSSIPLSEMMQFNIEQLSNTSIKVTAPLEPNVNIHGTGFAGSIYSLAVLTGWAFCENLMQLFGMKGVLVVARAEIKYRSPITEDLQCATSATEDAAQAFYEAFKQRGTGRLELNIAIGSSENARLQATYVAKAKS